MIGSPTDPKRSTKNRFGPGKSDDRFWPAMTCTMCGPPIANSSIVTSAVIWVLASLTLKLAIEINRSGTGPPGEGIRNRRLVAPPKSVPFTVNPVIVWLRNPLSGVISNISGNCSLLKPAPTKNTLAGLGWPPVLPSAFPMIATRGPSLALAPSARSTVIWVPPLLIAGVVNVMSVSATGPPGCSFRNCSVPPVRFVPVITTLTDSSPASPKFGAISVIVGWEAPPICTSNTLLSVGCIDEVIPPASITTSRGPGGAVTAITMFPVAAVAVAAIPVTVMSGSTIGPPGDCLNNTIWGEDPPRFVPVIPNVAIVVPGRPLAVVRVEIDGTAAVPATENVFAGPGVTFDAPESAFTTTTRGPGTVSLAISTVVRIFVPAGDTAKVPVVIFVSSTDPVGSAARNSIFVAPVRFTPVMTNSVPAVSAFPDAGVIDVITGISAVAPVISKRFSGVGVKSLLPSVVVTTITRGPTNASRSIVNTTLARVAPDVTVTVVPTPTA